MRPIYILATSMILLQSMNAAAQNCKYDYEKKDPFSGKMSKGNTATIKQTWKLGFNRLGDDYTLGIFVNFVGVREDMIHTGDTLLFAIEGEAPIAMYAAADVPPTSSVTGSQIQTWYQAQYKIPAADVKRISEKTLTAIRVYFGKLFMGLDIPEKNSKKIQKAAACILE